MPITLDELHRRSGAASRATTLLRKLESVSEKNHLVRTRMEMAAIDEEISDRIIILGKEALEKELQEKLAAALALTVEVVEPVKAAPERRIVPSVAS